jgi:predicted ATPase
LEFDTPVTFLTGDKGSGKSTLIEAIALSLGFNADGGTRNFNFENRPSESHLYRYLRVSHNIGAGRGGFTTDRSVSARTCSRSPSAR